MKLYWSIDSFPEFAGLPKDKRKQIWKACCWKSLVTWKFWIFMILIMVVLFFILFGIIILFSRNYIGGLFCSVIVSLIAGLIMWQGEHAVMRSIIRKYLNSSEKRNL